MHHSEFRLNQGFPLIPASYQQRPLEQRSPTLGHLPLAPIGSGIRLDLEHQVIVIAHHRIGTNTDGKQSRQLAQLVHYPLAPMLVTLAGVGIFPAQKRPPHTATDHMIVRRILQTDLT